MLCRPAYLDPANPGPGLSSPRKKKKNFPVGCSEGAVEPGRRMRSPSVNALTEAGAWLDEAYQVAREPSADYVGTGGPTTYGLGGNYPCLITKEEQPIGGALRTHGGGTGPGSLGSRP